MDAGQQLSGSLNNYYLAAVPFPQRKEQPAYVAECEDIIEALELSFDEANIFKEIWRSANARKGNGKPGHRALYGAEKIAHYAARILRRRQREQKTQDATTDLVKKAVDSLEPLIPGSPSGITSAWRGAYMLAKETPV